MTTIVVTTVTATLMLAFQPRRVLALGAMVPTAASALALTGAAAQLIGLYISGRLGHVLVGLGMAGLLGAAACLRWWPGGWLLLLGVALNGLAIAIYGRMPISPAVLATLQLGFPAGTVLAGSKDIVARGLIVDLFGDRFVLQLPFISRVTVWSIGDLLIVSGVLRAATSRQNLPAEHPKPHAACRWDRASG